MSIEYLILLFLSITRFGTKELVNVNCIRNFKIEETLMRSIAFSLSFDE